MQGTSSEPASPEALLIRTYGTSWGYSAIDTNQSPLISSLSLSLSATLNLPAPIVLNKNDPSKPVL